MDALLNRFTLSPKYEGSRLQVGAGFGAMTGLKLLFWLPESWNIQPGVYAVVAATATLAGVFRSSISLVRRACCLAL